jgi:nucleoside-diphosphate-sugar epimerase
VTSPTTLPGTIADQAQLEAMLSEPSARVIETMARVDGDLIVLGVGGKMGPTLARMAKRASELAGRPRRIIGVSRFGAGGLETSLHAHGIETIRCDLLDEAAVAALPVAPNVIFMAGRKFGSSGGESLTWAMNCLLPAIACRHYAASRFVAFSTGNVYGLTMTGRGGSTEDDPPHPVGEYAMSCLGRERVIEHFSRTRGLRAALLRLNYAVEMRYGILVDLALRLLAGESIDLTMGYVNVIWQADASAMALCALEHAAAPPLVVNLAGREESSVRAMAEALGRRLGVAPRFTGSEAPDGLLSNGARGWSLLGEPRVAVGQLIDWTADWLARGGPVSGKPTKFESRGGEF